MKRTTTALAVILTIAAAASIFAADPMPEQPPFPDSLVIGNDEDVTKARLIMGNDQWLQPHFFIQTGFSSAKTWDESAGETKRRANYSKDFYIRACRIILNGQFAPNVYFYFASEDLKAGKSAEDDSNVNSGTGKNNIYTQDAYIKFMPARAFQIYAGLLTVPLTRVNIQSDATLLGTEPVPVMSTMSGFSNNGRDTGVMLRGVAPYFEYRLGAYRGLGRKVEKDSNGNPKTTRNYSNSPRLSARITMNGADSEDGYFYSENYLGKRLVFSMGGGIDYQKDVNKSDDYLAFATDFAVDMPVNMANVFGISVFQLQGGFLKVQKYPSDADTQIKRSTSLFAEFGILMYDTIQPMARFSYRDEAGTGAKSYKTITGGFNYFINGHHANIKLGVDVPIGKNKKYADQLKGTLQFQGYM